MQIPVEVFWTGSSRRWGLRACRRINKGVFLYCYNGVVIPVHCKCDQPCEWDDCVHRPARSCSKCGCKRIVALVTGDEKKDEDEDFEDEENEDTEETRRTTYSWEMPSSRYEIDASRFRNVAAFMNHTCEDWNVEARYAWGEHLDPTIPMLAFYTRRPIETGEEILAHYGYTMDGCRCKACERINLEKERLRQAELKAKISPKERLSRFKSGALDMINNLRRHKVVRKRRAGKKNSNKELDYYVYSGDTVVARSMVEIFEYFALPTNARLLNEAREIEYFDDSLEYLSERGCFKRRPKVLRVLKGGE
jgi:hypothetical protein